MTIVHFNQTIDSWISALDLYTFPELIAKPDDASWSLGQVYMHLIEETSIYLGQIRTCLEQADNTSGKMTLEAMQFFSKNEYPDIRITGDPFTASHIPQPTGKAALLEQLITLRRNMNETWIHMNNPLKNGKTLHPGHGYLSALEWLQHAEMHMRHHLRQKSRLDRFLNKV